MSEKIVIDGREATVFVSLDSVVVVDSADPLDAVHCWLTVDGKWSPFPEQAGKFMSVDSALAFARHHADPPAKPGESTPVGLREMAVSPEAVDQLDRIMAEPSTLTVEPKSVPLVQPDETAGEVPESDEPEFPPPVVTARYVGIPEEKYAALQAELSEAKQCNLRFQNLLGAYAWNLDRALEHFTDEGELRGDGKWRQKELHGRLTAMRAAEEEEFELTETRMVCKTMVGKIAELQAENERLRAECDQLSAANTRLQQARNDISDENTKLRQRVEPVSRYCLECERLAAEVATLKSRLAEYEAALRKITDDQNWCDHDNSPYGIVRVCVEDAQAIARAALENRE